MEQGCQSLIAGQHIQRIKYFDKGLVIGLSMRHAIIKCSEVIKPTVSMYMITHRPHLCCTLVAVCKFHDAYCIGFHGRKCMKKSKLCMQKDARARTSRLSVMLMLCTIKTHWLKYMKWDNSYTYLMLIAYSLLSRLLCRTR